MSYFYIHKKRLFIANLLIQQIAKCQADYHTDEMQPYSLYPSYENNNKYDNVNNGDDNLSTLLKLRAAYNPSLADGSKYGDSDEALKPQAECDPSSSNENGKSSGSKPESTQTSSGSAPSAPQSSSSSSGSSGSNESSDSGAPPGGGSSGGASPGGGSSGSGGSPGGGSPGGGSPGGGSSDGSNPPKGSESSAPTDASSGGSSGNGNGAAASSSGGTPTVGSPVVAVPGVKSGTGNANKQVELHNMVQQLYMAQAQVQLEANEIQRAQAIALSAQQSLEVAANHVRSITAALQTAQQDVAAAAMRAQTAQLQLAAHDQLLFAARQKVDALSSQMVGLQAQEGIVQAQLSVDIPTLLSKLKQPLPANQRPSAIPSILENCKPRRFSPNQKRHERFADYDNSRVNADMGYDYINQMYDEEI